MKAWIDAYSAPGAERVCGLDPLERQLRTMARAEEKPDAVIVSGGAPAQRNTALTVIATPGDQPAGARLTRALAEADGPLLVLDATSLVDPRLIAFLLRAGPARAAFGGEGRTRAAALRLTSDMAATVPPDATSVLEIADALVARSAVPALRQDEFPTFIGPLRRSVDFWLFATPDAASRRAREYWMFRSNTKGSTDFLTRWVYPPIVWPMVKACIRYRIHPNVITVLSALIAFAVVPMFAAGAFLPGMALAFLMTILDSVDGKVARLTLTDSAFGNVLDHGLDIVHPPLWYLAWAWGLGARGPDDPAFAAALWLIGFYVADRVVLGIAKARFKRGLHAVTALDGAVRTWIARRNVNMVIFSLALIVGAGEAGLIAVAAWQGVTLAWHTFRTFWLKPSEHRIAKAA